MAGFVVCSMFRLAASSARGIQTQLRNPPLLIAAAPLSWECWINKNAEWLYGDCISAAASKRLSKPAITVLQKIFWNKQSALKPPTSQFLCWWFPIILYCRVDCPNDNPKMYNINCLIFDGAIFYILQVITTISVLPASTNEIFQNNMHSDGIAFNSIF